MAAIFSIEAVKAKEGDCLLLHYGDGDDRRVVLVDGGPPGVYKSFLEPRLKQLTATLGDGDGGLPLELVMVSHIDQDHVAGVLQLLRAVEQATDDGRDTPYDVRELWHNAFHKIAGDEAVDPASLLSAVEKRREPPRSELVLASVAQGQDTAVVATKLGIDRNGGQPLVLAGHRRELPGGLVLDAIGPSEARVEALKRQWAEEIGAEPSELVAAQLDDSVFNLSSLLVVASLGKLRMLLTGDGLAGDVLAGLEAADLLDAKRKAHFDVLKVPHHGSDRNVDTEFFRRVTADHYVISGDGKHSNPELATLEMIDDARGGDEYDIWLTYRTGREGLGDKIAKFAADQRLAKRKARLHFPEDGADSLIVDLGTAVDY